MNNGNEELQNILENAGIKSSIVSIQHLPDLQSDMENLIQQGILGRDFYDEIVCRYNDLQFNIELPENFSEAKSIIITAAPQPKISVRFEYGGKYYPVVIPPTYLHNTDEKAFHIISRFLNQHGYKMSNAVLPEKSLAVHCGLAAYGKNNIAYTDGWGSFFRLKAFYSDMPCHSDNWHEFKIMERCNKCTACFKNCPTKAIANERFLIDATQCLTYLNEGPDEFPGWIDPSWHNCLIGCMICQDVCPANKKLSNWIVEAGDFSESETLMILEGHSRQKLSDVTIEKLKRIYLLDDYDLLGRNLDVLINNCV